MYLRQLQALLHKTLDQSSNEAVKQVVVRLNAEVEDLRK
jgi:hypothetical protein